jgi:hypothetical protein
MTNQFVRLHVPDAKYLCRGDRASALGAVAGIVDAGSETRAPRSGSPVPTTGEAV